MVAAQRMIIAGTFLLCCDRSMGQIKDPARFEVVSIKRANGDVRPTYSGGPGRSSLTRTAYSRASLSNLIRDAYAGLRIVEPAFLNGDYFSVEAVLPAVATDSQLRDMRKTMLIDRFGLVTHRETRPVPDYDLTYAEKNAALSVTTKGNQSEASDPANIAADKDGFPLLPGTYDFKLVLPVTPGGASEPGEATDPAVSLANIAGLLKRQIGLTLKRATVSVDTLIVDHINQVSTPN